MTQRGYRKDLSVTKGVRDESRCVRESKVKMKSRKCEKKRRIKRKDGDDKTKESEKEERDLNRRAEGWMRLIRS